MLLELKTRNCVCRQLDTKFANGKTAGELGVQILATARSGAGQDLQVSGYGNEINEVMTDEEGRAQFTLDVPRDAQILTITVSTMVDFDHVMT